MQPNRSSRRDPDREAMRAVSAMPTSSVVDVDPEDPSQLLDEAGPIGVVDMNVEAQPHAEADAELDAAVATTADDYNDTIDATDLGDAGDLYGLDVNADRESFIDSALGEHVFETLEKKVAEGGAEPEVELDIEDDSDEHRGHHKTDRP